MLMWRRAFTLASVVVLVGLAIFLLSHRPGPGTIRQNLTKTPQSSTTFDSAQPQSFETDRYAFRNVTRSRAIDNEPALLGVSHSQQLRVWVNHSGVTITPSALPSKPQRSEEWKTNLNLKRFGRADQFTVAQPITSETTKENRIDLTRKNTVLSAHAKRKISVSESYENSPEGIKQVFTIDGPTSNDNKPLKIVIAVAGSLTAQATNEQLVQLLNSKNESVLKYGQVNAIDATGKPLNTRLQVNNSEIEIEVDDQSAVAPLTVAPLILAEQIINLTPGNTFHFGGSVDITSNTLVIGAPYEDTGTFHVLGAAYTYRRDKFGRWISQSRLVFSGTRSFETLEIQFGWVVKLSGETLMVGTREVGAAPDPQNPDFAACDGTTGSVQIHQWDGRDWVLEAEVSDPSGLEGTFGAHADLSGNTIVVGSLPVCHNPNRQGTAYVFTRKQLADDNGPRIQWQLQSTLTSPPPPPPAYGGFGTAVAISGDTIAVGGAANNGVALFKRTGEQWNLSKTIPVPAQGSLASGFGTALDINGDRMIIGAHSAGPGPRDAYGAVYIYENNGTDWIQKQRLTADELQIAHNFGWEVAINGDRAVVGVSRDINNGFFDAGCVYVFDRGADGVWVQRQKIFQSDPHGFAVFGQAVATNGRAIAVGAPWHGVGGRYFGQGQAYVYAPDDLDQDGLTDDMELNGYTANGQFIDLKAMGANPQHKDIFIHAEWMAGLKPNPKAIQMVVDAFAKAPVLNPDGKPGINLHIDLGPGSNMTRKKKWGSLSQSSQRGFVDVLGQEGQPFQYAWDEFDFFKSSFIETGRRAAFHYFLFANDAPNRNRAGAHRGSPGADSIIFMAQPENRVIFTNALVIMHELGHQLGLDHGGPDHIDRKPNYLSIMNSAFTETGILNSNNKKRRLDFSRSALPTLNERLLDELVGIQDPQKHLTTWSIRTALDEPAGSNKCISNLSGFNKIFLPTQSLDWNCDGLKTPTPVVADLNSDGFCVRNGADNTLDTPLCSPAAPSSCDDKIVAGGIVSGQDRTCNTTALPSDVQYGEVGVLQPDELRGFNDWDNIDLLGGGIIGNLIYVRDPDVEPRTTRNDERDHASKIFDISPALLAENSTAPLDEVNLSVDEGPAPLTVNFDGSASTAVNGTIVTYEWDFGDGSTGTGANVSHTYTQPGEYFASLNVTDSNGNVNLVPLLYLITVNPEAPTPTPTPTIQPTPTPSGTPGVGDVDPGFRANVSGNFSTQIRTLLVQPDGKTLVGGEFESFAGCARQGLARLNADGSCDTTFDSRLLFSLERIGIGGLPFRVKPAVRAIALQPDGKVLVGLAYDSCCGTQPGKMIVRLNTDGTLDNTFNLSVGSNGTWNATVYGIAVQPDGKVIIVGNFAFDANSVFGPNTALAGVARLNQDGSLDTTFNASAGSQFTGGFRPDGIVNAVAFQSDGKIIIGGNFVNVGGNVARFGLARLNSDGSADLTYNVQNQQTGIFSSELGLNTNVFAIALQSDGKAVIAGDLRRGSQPEAFMRLNTDGSRDPSFVSGSTHGPQFGSGRSLAIQSDGKIVISGDFRITTTPNRNYIARLNSDGTLDTTFDTGTGTLPPNGGSDQRSVDAVALQPDGKVMMGGRFEFYKDQPANEILRLDSTGNRDVTFDSPGPGYNGEAYVIVRQPNQKLLVGYKSIAGSKSMLLNAHRTAGIGRLNPDGSTDTSFTSPFDPGFSNVFAIAVQGDGKILVGGSFRLQGSTTQINLVRLNSNGSLDATFTCSPNDHVQAIIIQSDGKIVIGGLFTQVNSVTQFRLARLNTNGSLDQTWASNGVGGGVRTLVQQPDGKIIVAGLFNGLNSTLRNNIARLNANGSLDESFDPGAGPDGGVVPVLLQPDGKLVIGGFFQNFAGVPRPFIARLGPTGQLDTTFVPVNPAQRVVNALALQMDGKIDVGCSSSGAVAETAPANTIFRLNTNGTLDSSFPPNAEIELDVQSQLSSVNTLLLDQQEQLIVGGQFDVVNDAAHLAISRILLKPLVVPTPTPTPTATPTPTPTPAPTPTPTPEPTPTPFPTPTWDNTFQFPQSTFSIQEDCTALPITVTRSGVLTRPATVSYTTTSGTASERSDYTLALGRLHFAPGETSKSFLVLISEDSFVEGNETFTVSLTQTTNGGLGSTTTATVQIIDDPTEPLTNAIDNAPTFVCQHYHDFLNRQPDAAGLAFWTNEITSCGTNAACIELKKVNVSAAFYLSIEFQQTGYFVERIAMAAFGNNVGTSVLSGSPLPLSIPVVRRDDLLSDSQKIGEGIVVGQPGWEQKLETNKQRFLTEFAKRQLISIRYPFLMTPEEFVDEVFANAGVTPTTAERNAAIAEFGITGSTLDSAARGRVLRRIGEDQAVNASQFNRAFVLMQYIGYLRRNPDDPQDTDHTGYDFWLTKLNQFNGDFLRAEMVKAFLTSLEYRSRFGNP